MFEDDNDDLIEFSSVQVSEEEARAMMTLNSLPVMSYQTSVTLPTMQSVLTHIDEISHRRERKLSESSDEYQPCTAQSKNFHFFFKSSYALDTEHIVSSQDTEMVNLQQHDDDFLAALLT